MRALALVPEPLPSVAAEVLDRLRQGGPGALDDAEALQLLAGLEPDQVSRLLVEFGSLPEIFGADVAALSRIATPDSAGRIALLGDLARRLLAAPLAARSVLSSWGAVCDYLRIVSGGRPREQFRVLFLDKRNRLIRDEVMGDGTVDHAPVYPREVVRRALELNASAIVLSHNVKQAQLRPVDRESENAPDYRIFAGGTEFGAAWKKTSRETNRDYLSVKLDDPSFPAPIYANLVDADDGYSLVWSRNRMNS